ncbi:hypothetical protein [Accumulibacter sp.]|uniref:hypothetical protein n=1 Tax=Accumulibacter sp. TaxID=2053492 RepID=UPI002C4F85E6|nr:hypothetical protein [Accumulibacter sp.]HRF04361.1 hypothetical protein [Accumulibacter sp.]
MPPALALGSAELDLMAIRVQLLASSERIDKAMGGGRVTLLGELTAGGGNPPAVEDVMTPLF